MALRSLHPIYSRLLVEMFVKLHYVDSFKKLEPPHSPPPLGNYFLLLLHMHLSVLNNCMSRCSCKTNQTVDPPLYVLRLAVVHKKHHHN